MVSLGEVESHGNVGTVPGRRKTPGEGRENHNSPLT